MKRMLLLAALGLCGLSRAAIAPGTSGNGELFVSIQDASTRVSYTLDLGLRMDDFFVLAQQDSGFQQFWVLDDANWSAFLSLVDVTVLRWAVVAIDSTGPNTPGQQRLFTTVRQGQESDVDRWSNGNFSLGIGASQAGRFFDSINSTGTHGAPGLAPDVTIDGSSINFETDTGFAYYGKPGGLTPTYNTTAPFNATNAVGDSSWFYYVTRSSTSQIGSVLIDEFDNGNPTDGGNDGYWGLVRVDDSDPGNPFYDPDSPFAGQYVLSFTMPIFDLRTGAGFREFASGIGRTEYSGGFWVQRLSWPAAVGPSQTANGWVMRLGADGLGSSEAGAFTTAPTFNTPVPEPSSLWLFGAGAAAIGWRLRSRSKPRTIESRSS